MRRLVAVLAALMLAPTAGAAVHGVGAYAVPWGEFPAFQGKGFSLDITKKIPNPAPAAIQIVDARPSGLIAAAARSLHCKRSAAACPIAAKARAALLAKIAADIARDRQNPAVVGLYVQDDYAGNVLGILKAVHALSAQAGLPTVCGFGATLSFSKTGQPPFEFASTSFKHFTQLELLNYSRSACDQPLLYIFSFGKKAPVSDYSMGTLLPKMLSALKAKGWDGKGLIGAPQAWEGLPDTGDQIAEQTQAFCRAGATAITAFAWHIFPDRSPELFNSPGLQAGLIHGW